jgi:p-cumate 2,3-dioxygenase beta subunit
MTITRTQVEDFLYEEARLLDEWRLDEWLALFEVGARFEVPTTDWAGADAASSGYFVCDDWNLLRARVKRLSSRKAHAENPRSRTHRLIGNVRVEPLDAEPPGARPAADPLLRVRASFVIHRMRDGLMDPYVGWYDHRMVVTEDGLRFRLRRAVPRQELLRPGGRLSFIL